MKTLNLFVTSFLLGVLSLNYCVAQKKQNVYFLKDDGRAVKLRDSADYIRVIEEPDSGAVNYNVYEYFLDKTKKRIGTVSKFEPFLVYEGTQISYHKNGKKQEVSRFENGKPIGERYFYYRNGNLMKALTSEVKKVEEGFPVPGIPLKSSLVSYFDSTGVQMIKDGAGHYKTYEENADLLEEGDYLNGSKHGDWYGRFVKSGATFKEIYQNGVFVSGTSILADGSTVQYTKAEEMPEFPGGISQFYNYVGRTYRYPVSAIRMGVSGSVLSNFVVERDGSISNIRILRDIGYGTGDAAVRVLEKSPKWLPGKQHGVPVRVSYTLPIKLQTSR